MSEHEDPRQDPPRRETVLGELIRAQREAAKLSLRDLAALTNVSNPYLSQIERGLHEPSVRVLRSIADALGLSAETLLTSAGLLDDDDGSVAARPVAPPTVEQAIESDERLTREQRRALIGVYRSYLDANASSAPANRRRRRSAGADGSD
jgi:transcriptional regulator with XRE-family HTH domain